MKEATIFASELSYSETVILSKIQEMLRIVLCMVCVAVIMTSCLKNDGDASCPYENTSINAPQAERDSIEAFLTSMNIQAEEHSTGFYYQVVTNGTDIGQMGLCSEIKIDYSGKLKNGTQFDKQSGIRFILGSLIEGWKKGIPLIKKGGRITLFIPPSLAYGKNEVKDNQGVVVIPSNSMLVFDVSLIDYTVGN